MTRPVVLDTSAWWEILFDSEKGRRIARTYLDDPSFRALTVSHALGEMSARLAKKGLGNRIAATLATMEGNSEVVHLTSTAALAVGPLYLELRRKHEKASGNDAVMLAVARDLDALLVTTDRDFEGQRDVDLF